MRIGLVAAGALVTVSTIGHAWAATGPKFHALSFTPDSETRIEFLATEHAPEAKGSATIRTSAGPSSIDVSFDRSAYLKSVA